MKASAAALAGALFLAGFMLAALPASAQEQVDMRSTMAARGEQGYRSGERGYGAPAPAYAPYRAATAHGRYGMRYSGYASAPAYAASGVYGGYPRERSGAYQDGRSDPRLIGPGGAPYDYGRAGYDQSYGGGPLMASRRGGYSGEYSGGYADGGEPRYAYGRDDGADGGGYDRRYVRHDSYDGSGSGSSYEPYGYRGGRGYAGPYGYGYDRGEAEGYRYEGHIDRLSGFAAPPPHDSREAQEIRDACGCDDEDDGE